MEPADYTFAARADEGYRFVKWTKNGETFSTDAQITLALILTAWFTSRRNQIRGQGFFKVVFYMPNIITAASVAILFNALFGYPKGPVNDLLVNTGLRDSAFYFMNSPKATRWIVAFIQFWMWYGYTMIILISGVLGINPEIFEAAEIDGALADYAAKKRSLRAAVLSGAADRDGFAIDYCRAKGITIQTWSPFQRPLWRGRPNFSGKSVRMRPMGVRVTRPVSMPGLKSNMSL